MAMPPQTTVTTAMIAIGNQTDSNGRPNEVAFSNLIPCVKGKTSAIFCNADGITSQGKVAPEKMSIGKYRRLAATLAVFVSGATPPTISPMLNIENITEDT